MTIMNMIGGNGKKDDIFYEIHQAISGVTSGYLSIKTGADQTLNHRFVSSDPLGWNNYAVVYDGYLYILDENGRKNTGIAMTKFIQGTSDGSSIYICTKATSTSRTWIEVVKGESGYTQTTVDWVPANTMLIFDRTHIVADNNGYCAFMEKQDDWSITRTTNCKTPSSGFTLWSPKRWFSTNNVIYTETNEIAIGDTIRYSASYDGEFVFTSGSNGIWKLWLETNPLVVIEMNAYPGVMYDGENIYYANSAFNKNELKRKGIHRSPIAAGTSSSSYSPAKILNVFASPPKRWSNYVNSDMSSYSDAVVVFANANTGVLYNSDTETILY